MKPNRSECRTHGCCSPANKSGYCEACEQERARRASYADEETARVELPPTELHPDPEIVGMVVVRSWWNWQTEEFTQVWKFKESEEKK